MIDWNFDGKITGEDIVMHDIIIGHPPAAKTRAKSLPIKSVDRKAPVASQKQVKDDLGAYVTKHLFSRNSIDAADVTAIVKMLTNRYGNIVLWLMEDNHGYPVMRIRIKHFMMSEELKYEIRVDGRRNRTDRG